MSLYDERVHLQKSRAEVAAGQELQVGSLLLRFEDGAPVEPAAELAEWLLHSGLEHLMPAFERRFGYTRTQSTKDSNK